MKTKITFMALIFSALCLTASAQVATWTGPDAGDWSTPANWSTAALPLLADSVSIPAGKTVTISENAGTINRLSVSGKLIIAVAGTLGLDQTVSTNSGAILNLIGGEIENNGTLTIKNSVTTSANTGIQFSESVDFDNKFSNNGEFSLDLTVGTYASLVGRGIGMYQKTNGKVSTFKMGGTMNFNLVPTGCLFETDGGGNLTIDGTSVIGNVDNYKDIRFIKLINGGNITIASTANITFYSKYANASNGVINIQSSLATPATIFTNNGILTIHSAGTGAGIYFNPQSLTAVNTMNNNGTIILDGSYPKGAFLVNSGNAGAPNAFNNNVGATLSLSNSHVDGITLKTITATAVLSLVNEGVINLSSAAHSLYAGGVISGAGTINYNYVAGIKQLTDFNGKVYSNGNKITVNLMANENAQFILLDITGRTLKTANVQGENNTFTMNNLTGIFVVRLLTAKGSYSQKISLN